MAFFGISENSFKVAKQRGGQALSVFLALISNAVLWFFVIGILLIVIGQANYLGFFIPSIKIDSSINPILKSIGAALIGSGVFTVVIKSNEYSKIFSNVIGEIVWSKKFIEKRDDKRDIWSMVSKLLYEEKFPDISDQIEDIIATKYFPTNHEYYLEDYELTINILDHENPLYEKHHETARFKVKPMSSSTEIFYEINSYINSCEEENVEDLSNFELESLCESGQICMPVVNDSSNDGNKHRNKFSFKLSGKSEYQIEIKRVKTICKKSNPDKIVTARSIINGMRINLIHGKDKKIDFHKVGTIYNFVKSEDQINGQIRFTSWHYNGIVLHNQGLIMIFR